MGPQGPGAQEQDSYSKSRDFQPHLAPFLCDSALARGLDVMISKAPFHPTPPPRFRRHFTA